ncbi:hypothetical protein HZA41_01905, partial [Candidatus Peregrinibacteria bacterium]|nr:hypothetical protein [Candidatus Peregrinibacteria bacterium]
MKIKLIIFGILYRKFFKRALFLIDAERVHTAFTHCGEILGAISAGRTVTKKLFYIKPAPILSQNIAGIPFTSPIGLAAGFDYETRLTQILPAIGFGWSTVGTITNMPYAGNPPPRLGRLTKSQSLWVNKGFKNLGALETIERLHTVHFRTSKNCYNARRQAVSDGAVLFGTATRKRRSQRSSVQFLEVPFEIPIGISLGRTNAPMNQKESVQDIVSAFTIFEKSKCRHSYYELNISCPNLFGDVNFYTPRNLEELLCALEKLKIIRPIFVKMPTTRTNEEIKIMLDSIGKFPFLKGVIFGNRPLWHQDALLSSWSELLCGVNLSQHNSIMWLERTYCA